MNEDLERLVAHVRSLREKGEFPIVEEIDGCYNHMAATAADAILQANLRYETHVAPRVEAIPVKYPEAKTTSAALHVLESVPATEFLNWRGQDRADRFVALLKLFQANRIETEDDLKRCFVERPGLIEPQLLAQRGIGLKTVSYLKILVGLQTSAVDRHLFRFLEEAGLHYSNEIAAQSLINAAADRLNIQQALFDHSIWHYMKDKKAPAATAPCTKSFWGKRKQQG